VTSEPTSFGATSHSGNTDLVGVVFARYQHNCVDRAVACFLSHVVVLPYGVWLSSTSGDIVDAFINHRVVCRAGVGSRGMLNAMGWFTARVDCARRAMRKRDTVWIIVD
jgi:hypothetical protein